jgi:hypothetical protein
LAAASGHAAYAAQPAAFIDLGTLKHTAGVTSMAHLPESAPVPAPGIGIWIDLGGGVVLTITTR